MKTFIADTNVFVRFLLQDNLPQAKKSRHYFSQAAEKKIELKVISEIIPEIEYILKKFYGLPRKEVGKCLSVLAQTSYFQVEKRNLWIEALRLYRETAIDLMDIFLFLRAKEERGQVLSFDKDFKKLTKIK